MFSCILQEASILFCLIISSGEDVWEYSLMAGMNFPGVHRAGSGFKIILNL